MTSPLPNIKDVFISRWEGGMLIEADYSQLELIALAELSGDEALKKALTSGDDFHRLNAAKWKNIPPGAVDSETRRQAKVMTFQLTYGAGPTKMSESLGIDINTAKQFINTFYDSYPNVKVFQEENTEWLHRWKSNAGDKFNGQPVKRAYLPTLTGRRYLFIETVYDNVFRGVKKHSIQFKPTEIKNYPVQGFATGDIVPEMLGRIVWKLHEEELIDWCLPVVTVHDSVMFDCHPDYVLQAASVIKHTLEDVNGAMKERFDLSLDMPYNVEVKVGPSWGKMIKVVDL